MSAGTKHDVLTEGDLAVFEAPGLFRRHLHEHAAASGRRPRELRVLEWGCGRGRLLAALLAEGFDAYGVDVDAAPLANGRDLFAKRGWEPDRRLLLWRAGEPLPFPNGFFDAIVSDQVFEHVGPLEPVVAEMARLTAVDGFGLHRFPSHQMVLEPHLLMPFVHWLPKNALRYAAIRALVALGVQPGWRELAGHSPGDCARRYYEYSVEKTYYRPPRVLRRALARHGLEARLRGSDGGSRLVRLAARLPVLDRAASAWRRRFHTTWMLVRKPAREAGGIVPAGGDTAARHNLAKRLRLVEGVADPLAGRRVLDAGCGAGEWVRALAARGAAAWGVEIQREKLPAGPAPLARADVARLPFRDESFDVALLNEVLEHVPDDAAALREVHRALAPGGRLVVFSPNRLYPFETHGVFARRSGRRLSPALPFVPWLPAPLSRRLFRAWARNYWPRELRRLVGEAGFRIERRFFVWQTFENISGRQPVWLRPLAPGLRTLASLLERLPGIRAFGVSQGLVARRDAARPAPGGGR